MVGVSLKYLTVLTVQLDGIGIIICSWLSLVHTALVLWHKYLKTCNKEYYVMSAANNVSNSMVGCFGHSMNEL